MTTYSHSKLGTFQQCKFKYKLQYVDKVKVDVPDTVETFMGKKVHETLEKLYKDLKYQKLNSKEKLITFYLEN
ncbi:PD-(D/E)XK nuclease family protein [Candidatus Woesearchaeota archaeon]|nr:PD-(D/E)XK nuclease family protein [Candidatus Woesearchaeota archaeon]